MGTKPELPIGTHIWFIKMFYLPHVLEAVIFDYADGDYHVETVPGLGGVGTYVLSRDKIFTTEAEAKSKLRMRVAAFVQSQQQLIQRLQNWLDENKEVSDETA